MVTYYEYSKCTTCRKGKKFLKDHGVEIEVIDMVDAPPSVDTLKQIVEKSDYAIDEFFNKRGTKFKDLGLGEKLSTLSDDEKLQLLSSDGMLIKRPMVVGDDTVVLGFKEDVYKDQFKL